MKKERDIEKMEKFPYGCTVKRPGFRCAYRAWYHNEISSHIEKHEKSIRTQRRNKSRYYEVQSDDGRTQPIIQQREQI